MKTKVKQEKGKLWHVQGKYLSTQLKESESEKQEERERHIKAERQKIGGGETFMI